MRTLLFALCVFALVGCKGFRPVGPLAKKVPITQQGQPLKDSPTSDAIASSRVPTVKPTPPTLLVRPEDVTTANAHDMAAKLAAELSTDMKSSVNAPVTVEVSRIKGGVKQP